MSKAWMIAATSLRRLFRDRTSLVFVILLPFVIILIIGTATARFDDEAGTPVGVLASADGPLSTELQASLADVPLLELSRYESHEALARDVRRGAVVAGIVVPDDYDAALASGDDVEIAFLADPTRGFPSAVRTQVAAVVAAQGSRLQAARFVTLEVGGSFEDNLEEAVATEGLLPLVEVTSTETGERPQQRSTMTGFEYQAPSNIILFVFITSLAWSGQLIEARRLGITRRMIGTPTRAGVILGGEALSRFAIALFQAIYILGIGVLIFGVGFGNPLGAAAIIGLFVLVGTSFGMLFGTIFRTAEQAGSIGAPVGIAMGMLAGCMWPRFIMPEPMQRIGELFPHAYAMDAWIELIARGGGIADISSELLVLAGYSAVILPLATWRLRRSVVA